MAIIDGTGIQDDVFIGPNATFTDIASRAAGGRRGMTTMVIGRGATSAAARCSFRVNVGEGAMVGAGAVVTQDCRCSRSSSAIPPGWSVRLVTTNASPTGLLEATSNGTVSHRLGVDGRARGDPE